MNRQNALRLLSSGEAGIAKWNGHISSNGIIPSLSHAQLAALDLSEVMLDGVDLRGANLTRTKLRAARLKFANLADCNLTSSDLTGADLSRTVLCNAKMIDSVLISANLFGANLDNADLTNASLARAILIGTRLRNSDLSRASLAYALLIDCNLYGARCGGARLGFSLIASDMTEVDGLDRMVHVAPSRLCVDVNDRVNPSMLDSFLMECGCSLIGMECLGQRLQPPPRIRPCFISYSRTDEALASRILSDLRQEGVRCWLRGDLSRATWSIWDNVHADFLGCCVFVVIVSSRSIVKAAINSEITRALELAEIRHASKAEMKGGKDSRTLIFVRADDSIFQDWDHPKRLMALDQIIIDGSGWDRVEGKYGQTFDSLMHGLVKLSRGV